MRIHLSFHIRSALSALVVLATLSCASAGRQTVYVAASNANITDQAVASYNGVSQLVYVTNGSTVPIVVTSVRLYDCDNIRNRCEVVRMRVPVGPGHRELIVTVNPENPERAYSYRYSWTWEAAQ